MRDSLFFVYIRYRISHLGIYTASHLHAVCRTVDASIVFFGFTFYLLPGYKGRSLMR